MNYFYHPNPESDNKLSSEESFHCIKVLRKKKGDEIDIIDGNGNIYQCRVEKESHRSCDFSILNKKTTQNKKEYHTHIAIAPTKNQDRLEWFVEKACEIGIDEITFLHTKRAERKKVNLERVEKKAVSAMKQSKSLFKAQINELVPFSNFLQKNISNKQKFIAFVDHQNDKELAKVIKPKGDYLILIGPEGDFTNEELALAKENDFQMVSLGSNVLRTETAGIVACHTIELLNNL